ncbi:hypothetical protein JW935_01810 [candidate division KSB1 bacterium]|nr:hypothetical protein [candidate division KSB1 bacterium]
MRKINNLTSFFLLLFSLKLFANMIDPPSLGLADYYRGTAGERLFFEDSNKNAGCFFIHNDTRYYHLKYSWNIFSKKTRHYDDHSRFISLTSINYSPVNRFFLSIRIPYVKIRYTEFPKSHSGLSDIFFGLSYKIVMAENHSLFISTGVKAPTGDNTTGETIQPLGTSGYDIPILLNTNFKTKKTNYYFDAGCIIIFKCL